MFTLPLTAECVQHVLLEHFVCAPLHHMRVSLSRRRQDCYLFYVPARQSEIPDNTELRPLDFSFPALIYFFSFWPPLSPRQFSQSKTAESAKRFHLEVNLEVLHDLACNS